LTPQWWDRKRPSKWDLHNISGKLGVANRTQAVFVARRANLIR